MSGDALGLVGHVVDQLRFDELVDEGGFGYVYRGVHLGMDEPVAIKCLKVKAGDPRLAESFVKRFRDETKIAYRLSQGNLDIVRSISSGTLETPTGLLVPYMVLEWLEGWPLTTELAYRRDDGRGGFSLTEMVELLDSAALAIGFAHTQGVVHRDIKPGNLFLSRSRTGTRLKVLDFGLAKIVDPDGIMPAPAGAETGSHVFIASPSYGAPEQFSKKLGAVGPWSDVYSLALVALEMLTCAKVRPAKNLVEGMMRALDRRFAEPTPRKLGLTVGDAVEAAFARATALDSRERFQDGNEAWSAIRQAVRDDSSYNHAGPATVRNSAGKDTKAGFDKTVAMVNAPAIPAAPTPLPLSNRTLAFGPGQQAPSAIAVAASSVPAAPSVQPAPSAPAAVAAPSSRSVPNAPSSVGRPPISQGMPSSRGVPSSAPQKASGGLPMWLAVLVAFTLAAAGIFAIGYALRVRKK